MTNVSKTARTTLPAYRKIDETLRISPPHGKYLRSIYKVGSILTLRQVFVYIIEKSCHRVSKRGKNWRKNSRQSLNVTRENEEKEEKGKLDKKFPRQI